MDFLNSYGVPVSRGVNVYSGNVPFADQTAVYANSDAANTQKTFTLTPVAGFNDLSQFILDVYNPSTVTDLTVKVFAVESTLGGGTRDCYIGTASVPKSATVTGTAISAHRLLFNGGSAGCPLKFVVSNNTVLGASDGFTATFRFREGL